MSKRILTLVLAFLLCAGLLPVAALGGEFKFTDVPSDKWYYNSVKKAVEDDLINGMTETTYCPDDNLTYAQAVKLAACMNQKYTTGVVSLVNGDPWYKSYADYASMHGIISRDYDWNAPATRAGYMEIFAHALPDSALTVKNEIPDGAIPDVPMTHPQAKEIYKLYRAGVLEGSADMYEGVWTKNLCKPADNIQRSEVAAILIRMMYVTERKTFTIEGAPAALKIVKNPVSAALKAVDETVEFTVEIAGGKAPYIYKWFAVKDTGTVDTKSVTSDKTTCAYLYTFDKTTFEIAKTFYVYCLVTDSEGKTAESEKAAVTPYSDVLRVVKQPESYAVKKAGDPNASFAVEIAGGKGPYVYEWTEATADRTFTYKHTTSDTKDILKVTDADELLAKYTEVTVFCTVTDSTGAKVVTDKVKLTGNDLKAYVDPTEVTLSSTEEVFTLKTAVTGGTEPYKYQWFWGEAKDKMRDMSEWDPTFNTPNLTAKPDDRFEVQYMSCRVTDADGNEAFTPTVTITVKAGEALKITKQPQDQTVGIGDMVTFSVEAAGGTKPYTYTWFMAAPDEQDWPMADSLNGKPTLTFKVEEEDYDFEFVCLVTDKKGDYVFSKRVVVKEPGGSAGPLKITKQPVGGTFNEGETVTLSVKVTGGTGPYSYEWQATQGSNIFSRIGSSAAGSYTDTMSFKAEYGSFPANEYIRCVIEDSDGNEVISDEVYVEVKPTYTDPLKITKDLEDFRLGSKTDIGWFEVEISGGKAPYTYCWWVDVGFATDNAYTETNEGTYSPFAITDPYHYLDQTTYPGYVVVYCEITDANKTRIFTDEARLYGPEEQGGFDATISPSGTQTVAKGSSFTATVTPTGGTGSYTYEWDFSNDGGKTYKPLPSTTASQTVNCAYPGTVYMRCKVTSGAESLRVSVTIIIK